MTVLRRIRHLIVVFIACFLLTTWFVPTGEPRTIWRIVNQSKAANTESLVVSGFCTMQIESRSHLPETLTARLRWRLLMTQHYADQELSRSFNHAQARLNKSDGQDVANSDDSMTLTSFHPEATSAGDVHQVTLDENELLSGHAFWSRQHDRAEIAYNELLSLDKPSAVASPIATLPGSPTATGIVMAFFAGLTGASIMLFIDWLACRRRPPEHASDEAMLPVPASWFHVQAPASQRVALAMRTSSIIVIVLTSGMLYRSAHQEMGIERMTQWPLAEVADIF